MVVQIVVTINYLSYAMVLVKSLRRQGGAFTYSILLTDVSRKGMREVYEILIAEGIEVICCDDLEIEYLEKMRKYYSALEFNAACKILAIDFQLKKKHAKECLCLDADIYALGSVEKVLVDNQHDILVTPTALSVYPEDEQMPSDLEVIMCGYISGGFILGIPGWRKRL